MARWLAQLQEYNLQIEYRAGRTHKNADALSRRPVVCAETRTEEACPCFTGGCCRQAAETRGRTETKTALAGESAVCATETPAGGTRDPEDHPASTEPTPRGPTGRSTPPDRVQEDVGCAFPGLDDEQLRRTQLLDPDLAAVEAALREKKDALPGPWSGLYARLCVQNGVVRELTEAGQPGCICVPAQVRPQLLRLVHDHPLGGHDGKRRTRETLRHQYLWPKLAQDMAAWVQGCHACQQCGPKPARYQVPLRPFRVSRTNQLVGIDLQGPFARSHRGNRYILVAVEYFTRYPIAVAIPDKTALVVARAFVEHYVLKHGIPERVITGQGSEFEAELFQALCREFGIQKDRTMAYHLQANGMVERMNQTLAVKDVIPDLQYPGVYKLSCTCGDCYIGETKRHVSDRIREHKSDLKHGRTNSSAVADHCYNSVGDHDIIFSNTKVLCKPTDFYQRFVHEAIQIYKHRHNFNREDGFKLSNHWKDVLNRTKY
ncbi:uncharacterized protein LOC142930538 [Petromyzon marinus]|uniref:uncharacterized protein LOC142930538 n=1 Tax=Petromyzon marinus TaxID=7757 RepID=UPI003F7189CF